MKTNRKTALFRLTSLLCAALAAGGVLSSCGEAAAAPAATEALPENETVTEPVTEAEPDPFADFDYNGQKISIYTSTNDPGGVGNSNYLIEGPEEETGDVVNDSAFIRNRTVEELLNIDLVFTQLDADYTACGSNISKLIMAGDDVYDIIINDLFPLAGLSLEGNFRNMAEAPYIDGSKTYWYKDYMDQLSLDGKKRFLLAGDFFIDVLRSAHALYFNKNMLGDLYDTSDILYEEVLNGTWTYEKLLTYIDDCYQDLNGDGKRDMNDRYGLVEFQIWGPSIPFMISADLDYVTLNTDGTMTLAMNNERSVKLLELLNRIFYSDGTCVTEGMGSTDTLADQMRMFKSGQSLFLGYNRLGSLESLRDMEYEIGVIPYPKLDEAQEDYVSSSHDTTEIGCIPVTCGRYETTCAVLEVLCRETQKIVLPAYYETGLKVKYSRDDLSSQMIDLIHDHIGGSFALAYGSSVNDVFLKNSFYTPLSGKKTDFVSTYVKLEKSAQKRLDKIVESFAEAEG